MSTLRLRWRFFWSRRSRLRTWLAFMFLLAALLALIALALPPSLQSQVVICVALSASHVR